MWRQLQKSSKSNSEGKKRRETSFLYMLDDLFDIAHANALDLIQIQEDKEFLISQRQKGRPGSMVGRDMCLARREERVAKQLELETSRKQKYKEEQCKVSESGESSINNSSGEDEDVCQTKNTSPMEGVETNETVKESSRRRGKVRFITPRLVAALDRYKRVIGLPYTY